MGNPDVLVREEGEPPVAGKAATEQLKLQENHKERGCYNSSRKTVNVAF